MRIKASVNPISAPTNEYWLEMSAGAEAKNEVLEARADRIDGINDYDFNGDVAYFEASPSGFNDLVYGQIQTEHGEQPVRTLFGKQYADADEFEEVNRELEQPVKVAADGGTTEENYDGNTMADVDHTTPNGEDNRQGWFSRGLID